MSNQQNRKYLDNVISQGGYYWTPKPPQSFHIWYVTNKQRLYFVIFSITVDLFITKSALVKYFTAGHVLHQNLMKDDHVSQKNWDFDNWK